MFLAVELIMRALREITTKCMLLTFLEIVSISKDLVH